MKDPHKARLEIRMSESFKLEVEQAAFRANQTVSEYWRQAVRTRMESEQNEQS